VAHVEDVEWWSSNSLRVCVLSLHHTIVFPLSQKKINTCRYGGQLCQFSRLLIWVNKSSCKLFFGTEGAIYCCLCQICVYLYNYFLLMVISSNMRSSRAKQQSSGPHAVDGCVKERGDVGLRTHEVVSMRMVPTRDLYTPTCASCLSHAAHISISQFLLEMTQSIDIVYIFHVVR
jgi:hypothetical protein